MRKCSVCKILKPMTAFSKAKNKMGCASQCKSCVKK